MNNVFWVLFYINLVVWAIYHWFSYEFIFVIINYVVCWIDILYDQTTIIFHLYYVI